MTVINVRTAIGPATTETSMVWSNYNDQVQTRRFSAHKSIIQRNNN